MIVSLYAGILALMFVFLTAMTIRQRYKHQVRVGDGGHQTLHQHIRAHANFAEYVPFAIVMIALLEFQKTSVFTLHALGIALVAGRLLHAYGLTRGETYEGTKFTGNMNFRTLGMILTFSVYIVCAAILLMSWAERY